MVKVGMRVDDKPEGLVRLQLLYLGQHGAGTHFVLGRFDQSEEPGPSSVAGRGGCVLRSLRVNWTGRISSALPEPPLPDSDMEQ